MLRMLQSIECRFEPTDGAPGSHGQRDIGNSSSGNVCTSASCSEWNSEKRRYAPPCTPRYEASTPYSVYGTPESLSWLTASSTIA